jgi:hypothetical protein
LNHLTRYTISTRTALLWLVLIELFILLLSYILYGLSLETWQAIARFSGRLSLIVFSMIFILQGSSSSHYLPARPYFVFAVVHGIHLIELLIYIALSNNELIPIRLAGGFVAYLIVFVMPWIEHQYLNGKISNATMRLFENVSLYYIWFIFLMAYIPRIMGKLPNAGGSFTEHLTLFIFTFIIFAWRFTRQIRAYTVKKN